MADDSLATKYTLNAFNESSQKDFCVFQSLPDMGAQHPMGLAWLVKSLHRDTFSSFSWSINYSFVWAETGELKPGIQFDAGQVLPADPSDNGPRYGQNQAHFDKVNNAYLLTPAPVSEAREGSLYVQTKSNVTPGTVSVGIGMSDSGTCAIQAEQNMVLNFTPNPKYWIVAGTYTQGQVINVSAITGAAEVKFDSGYSMTAILGQDNRWTIKPTSQVNFDALRQLEAQHRVDALAAAGSGS